jgi:hypothetical protein
MFLTEQVNFWRFRTLQFLQQTGHGLFHFLTFAMILDECLTRLTVVFTYKIICIIAEFIGLKE